MSVWSEFNATVTGTELSQETGTAKSASKTSTGSSGTSKETGKSSGSGSATSRRTTSTYSWGVYTATIWEDPNPETTASAVATSTGPDVQPLAQGGSASPPSGANVWDRETVRMFSMMAAGASMLCGLAILL